jgi:hypothetical protein
METPVSLKPQATVVPTGADRYARSTPRDTQTFFGAPHSKKDGTSISSRAESNCSLIRRRSSADLPDGCSKEGIVAKPGSQTLDSKEFPAFGLGDPGEHAASRGRSASKIVTGRLDQAGCPVEDGVLTAMKILQSAAMGFGTLALCAVPLFAGPQSKDAATPKPAPTDQTSRITIQVSGGEGETPVENASIYIKYIEEHKVMKDKKVELNVKTNREGTAHVPDAPMGRVLVQVVADGWKTYGRWYDVNETRQTIKIHLDKPPRWY